MHGLGLKCAMKKGLAVIFNGLISPQKASCNQLSIHVSS